MDVRCEKCNTEYELDEDRLKPGGVTVKCTGCGHMFKVRRRSPTSVGVTAERPRRPSVPGQPPPAPERARRASSQGGGRSWLVRTESGEVKTCSELATLQQWIVSGSVGRAAEISRTGNTWKPLGDIPELAKFFEVGEEARLARQATPAPVRVPAATPAPPRRSPAASEPEPAPLSRQAAPQPAPPAAAQEQSQPLSPAALAAGRPPGAAGERKTGGWATAKAPRPPTDGGGPSGPTGGIARGIPTHDVAFAGSPKKPFRATDDEFGGGIAASSGSHPGDDDDDLFIPTRRGGVGKWIALVSVLLMAGAAAVVFLFVFEAGGDKVAAGAGDAGVETAVILDAAGLPPVPAEVLDAADEALRRDSRAELERIATQLAELDGPALAEILARGRIEAALAQDLDDQAAAADDSKQARALARAAQERLLEAVNLARRAAALDPDAVGPAVLMADVLRLQGKASREIERHLRKAPDQDFEARLVRALTLARDNKPRQARDLLDQLTGPAQASGDVRPRYRLALLELEADNLDRARTGAEAVLSISPEHAGAARVLDQLDATDEVATGDPMPQEVDEPSGGGSSGSSGSSGGSSSSSAGGYDGLLARADKLAENGDCRGAMGQYEKALDANPIGVAALTGMGYCHLDQREYASAHRKFKAALGISSRYQPALYGIAEAYQQQGLDEQAIGAYRSYLEEHPRGTRAEMAKRQLEKLGGGGSEPAPAPAPTPAPEPAPEPTSEPTPEPGSGSDSAGEPAGDTSPAPAGFGDAPDSDQE